MNMHYIFIGKWLKWRGFVQFTLSSFTWWIIILCSHEESDTVTPMRSFNTSRPPLNLWPNPWLIYFNLSLWYRPHEWHRGNKFCRRNSGKWNGNTDECALVLIKQQPKKPPKKHTTRGNYDTREDSTVFKCHPTWSKHGAQLCCHRDLG